jgi:pimeloyl-ACP methyl ester carboxylesterase
MTTVAQRMESHTVAGGGGLRLHVREWGNPDGPPILFIHGWSQSHLCWARQYDSRLADEFRLVAYDLRGHGMSEKPLGARYYTDGRLWADDVAAIIDRLRLDRVVLVGWSYGPFVILDYLREHGRDRIAAVNFVDGAVKLDEAAFGTLIGPGFIDNFAGAIADDLPTNIQALRRFLAGCTAKPLSAADFETALYYNAVVSPQVRAHLGTRQIDGDDLLRTLDVPLLVTHGLLDTVVLPAMADHVLATCRTAEASWYDGVGHAPFLEAPERFNRELAGFVRRARGQTL